MPTLNNPIITTKLFNIFFIFLYQILKMKRLKQKD